MASVLLSLAMVACGGGGGGSSNKAGAVATYPASPASLQDSNVVAVSVQVGPGNNVNIPYVSVTICEPGSQHCATIDHVLLDTGSTGLRLFASQVNPIVTLPPQTIGGSSVISECAQFLNTLAWGKVKLADITIGGERATLVPVQLMDTSSTPPSRCGGAPILSSSSDPVTSPPASNTQALMANGILGVGLFANDGQIYFDCASPTNSCELIRNTIRYPRANQQVQNPVALFTSGNSNGVLIQLPSLAASPNGAQSAQGYLIFGVGTQANNRLGAANVVPVNSLGYFTTVFRGTTYLDSFIDSGSNGLYFDDALPPLLPLSCTAAHSDFYCPATTQSLNARMQMATDQVSVDFSIANADVLFSQGGNYAFSNLGGALGGSYFDWGLPFFFGRSVYTVIEGKSVNTGTGTLSGPFNAFTTN